MKRTALVTTIGESQMPARARPDPMNVYLATAAKSFSKTPLCFENATNPPLR